MVFVGGKDYSEIESRLWLFAILGTALSMLQLLVYSVLARQGQRSIYLVWAALVALVAGGMTIVSTLGELLLLVVAVRSEEHTSELQSLMRISYAVFCLHKKTNQPHTPSH